MTPDEIATYARAVLAHVDAQQALWGADLESAAAAYRVREQAIDAITALSGHLRADVFSRVVLMARDISGQPAAS